MIRKLIIKVKRVVNIMENGDLSLRYLSMKRTEIMESLIFKDVMPQGINLIARFLKIAGHCGLVQVQINVPRSLIVHTYYLSRYARLKYY